MQSQLSSCRQAVDRYVIVPVTFKLNDRVSIRNEPE